jgi:hypothetical protein
VFTGQPRQTTKVIPTPCCEDHNTPKKINRPDLSATRRVMFRTSEETMSVICHLPAPKLWPEIGSWRRITPNTPNIIFGQCASVKVKDASQQNVASVG